jgi:UDP-2,3-diacylglucosamine pyrophosphatase LpxH
MLDAVVISDIHLGSENCQARDLVHLLDAIRCGDLLTRRLILNGDVFDSIDFRRLNKHHWKVLSELRKLSDDIAITWINGNHDGPAEIVSHLLGVTCSDEIIVESGGRRILFLHGHRFDQFITRYPLITFIADRFYNFLQRIDTSHAFARFAKRRSKTFLRCAEKIEHDARTYAARRGCDAVCCGHTHHAIEKRDGDVHYFNSGCWTEKPCTYLTVQEGEVELHAWAAFADTVLEDRVNPVHERPQYNVSMN